MNCANFSSQTNGENPVARKGWFLRMKGCIEGEGRGQCSFFFHSSTLYIFLLYNCYNYYYQYFILKHTYTHTRTLLRLLLTLVVGGCVGVGTRRIEEATVPELGWIGGMKSKRRRFLLLFLHLFYFANRTITILTIIIILIFTIISVWEERGNVMIWIEGR